MMSSSGVPMSPMSRDCMGGPDVRRKGSGSLARGLVVQGQSLPDRLGRAAREVGRCDDPAYGARRSRSRCSHCWSPTSRSTCEPPSRAGPHLLHRRSTPRPTGPRVEGERRQHRLVGAGEHAGGEITRLGRLCDAALSSGSTSWIRSRRNNRARRPGGTRRRGVLSLVGHEIGSTTRAPRYQLIPRMRKVLKEGGRELSHNPA